MISKDYKGYIEGLDLSKIPLNYLAYPSKNAIIHKGTAYSRPGIKNDGVAPTTSKKVIGEHVWKDALGGEKALRVTDTNLQLKWNGLWITIFSAFTSGALRVRFDTWIDDSGNIIKKRLFAVDGSDKVFEWNGALATIASVNTGAHTLTISENSTLEKLGFDPGNAVAQAVRIVRFSGGIVAGTDDYNTDDDMSDATMHLTGAFSHTPVADDIVIGAVVVHTDKLAGVDKDDIYVYKNHIGVANLDSISVYFSDAETKLDFTVPAAGSRTALSAFLINLEQNYTAMIARYNASTDETVLWISSVDSWLKVIALIEADTEGNWVKTESVSAAERLGAQPFCVADFKGDIIFLASDNTVQRIQTIDVLSKDALFLISDEVEGLLQRLDTDEARIYYLTRYIYIVCPEESITLMLDMVEGHWQTPQTLPMGLMSIIDGVQYGHSNVRDETFQMFVGRTDLGSPIESVFAFGYYQGYQRVSRSSHVTQDFFQKSFTKMGISCRMTKTTLAHVVEYYENNGSKAQEKFDINGSKVKWYSLPDDQTWASHIWAGASIGGADDADNPLGRVYAWRAYDAVAFFEFRPIITVNSVVGSQEQEFHLLGWYIDDQLSEYIIPEDLFIPR
jgi:hypothetical protein